MLVCCVFNICISDECSRFLLAPALAFPAHKLAAGKTVTSYPAMKDKLASLETYKYSENRVVVDGKIITSRGPGTAFEFALAIVEQLCGADKINTLKDQMLLSKCH